MIYSNWSVLIRVIIVGALAYVFVVSSLRLFGKRTLSQLNAFDFVVTVAIGSTLATTILNQNIGLSAGILALFLLICLQMIVASLSVKKAWFKQIVRADPRVLFFKGKFLEDAMMQERVRKEEILQAIRSQGIGSLELVSAVVLESNGNMSVILESRSKDLSSLGNVVSLDD
jgi:uncharacterized membrane protein YcaP (DUF421 family)